MFFFNQYLIEFLFHSVTSCTLTTIQGHYSGEATATDQEWKATYLHQSELPFEMKLNSEQDCKLLKSVLAM